MAAPVEREIVAQIEPSVDLAAVCAAEPTPKKRKPRIRTPTVFQTEKMCRMEKQAKIETKAQPVAMLRPRMHKRLLKLQHPGRANRRKHGVNRGDSGRFPQRFSKNTIDNNHALE
jgi:hypothetical protein